MKNSKFTILILILLTLGLVGLGCFKKPDTNQNENANANIDTSDIDTSDWKTYRNEEYGFEVKYPGEWNLVEASWEESTSERDIYDSEQLYEPEIQKVTFLEKTYVDWQGAFQVRILPNTENYTLDEWSKVFDVSTPNGVSLIEDVSNVTLDNISAKRYSVYAFDHGDTIIGTVYNGNIYIVKFAGGSNPNDSEIEKHQQIYTQILSTFKFIK